MSREKYQYPFTEFMQQCELNYSLLCRLITDWNETEVSEIRLDDESLITIEIKDEDYGGRVYSCRDPQGQLWNFGSYDPWQTENEL